MSHSGETMLVRSRWGVDEAVRNFRRGGFGGQLVVYVIDPTDALGRRFLQVGGVALGEASSSNAVVHAVPFVGAVAWLGDVARPAAAPDLIPAPLGLVTVVAVADGHLTVTHIPEPAALRPEGSA